MYREELPSEHKLERLRTEGQVPYSSFAAASAALLAVGLWMLSAAGGQWHRFMSQWAETEAQGGSLSAEAVRKLVEQALMLLAVPAGAAIVLIIAAGLAQTRFLFRPPLAGINMQRLNPFRSAGLIAPVVRALSALAALAIFCGLSVFAARALIGPAAGMLLTDPESAIRWPFFAARKLAPIVLAGAAICAFAAALLARVRFMLEHRMSREELEAEARESS